MLTPPTPTMENSNPNPNPNPYSNQTRLKMLCASAYHPKKRPDNLLGEDAHFISADHEVAGVADGVGSWASRGIDSGEYARQLMSNSTAAVLRRAAVCTVVAPMGILFEAYAMTTLPGASTACIVAHSAGLLRSANVGDSGFMIFRGRKLFFRSPVQQRGFNFPYQLGRDPKCDHPGCGNMTRHAVTAGDIIVIGTDGLFDNLFVHELEKILESVAKNAFYAINELQELANTIAKVALVYSKKKTRVSPFAEDAAAKFGKSLIGGKKDDITVIVGQIIMT